MKVAIIGAGVNGLYLGWKLSQKGHEVTVFEKNKAIGNKVCSGLFSERILDYIPEAKRLIENEINYVLIHFPKKTVELDFSRRFLVINHSELDKLVADLAHNSGANILLDQTIKEMPQGFDRIIGCDGANSFVRQSLGLAKPELRIGIQGFVNQICNKNFVEAWPCKNGFSWAIPRGKSIEYGTITDTNSAYRTFTDFTAEYKAEVVDIRAKMVPQGLPELNNETITLCGDAAGLTKPWSGGGVIWGLIAANMLIETFPDFRKYYKKMKRFFLPKIKRSKSLIKLVYFVGFKLPFFLPSKKKIEADFLL